MTGSLGALETIGKKTMDILSEGDPGKMAYSTPLLRYDCPLSICVGLRKKRELLGGKPLTLSEVYKCLFNSLTF